MILLNWVNEQHISTEKIKRQTKKEIEREKVKLQTQIKIAKIIDAYKAHAKLENKVLLNIPRY